MFLTVFGQKGGVAKTCTSIHLACVWAQQGLSVCVVDADRNRSATAYAARGMLPFEVVPVEVAAKATRHAQVIITCLLYTSPSPRDGLLSRMPSSA